MKIFENPDSEQPKDSHPIWLAFEFLRTFRALNAVKVSCFSKKLHKNYVETIDEFKNCILYLEKIIGLSITPKFHQIMYHIKPWCKKHNIGLGIVSEQVK